MEIMKLRFVLPSIKIRIALLYSLIFSVILIVLNASVLYGLKYYLIYQSFADISNQAETMLNKLSVVKGDIDFSNENLVFSIPENIYLKVIDKNGKVVYKSREMEDINIPYKSDINIPVKIEKDSMHLTYINEIYNRDGKIFYIQIIKNMESQYLFLKLLFVLMAFADAVGILISLIAGYFVTRQAIKPVDYMIKEVNDIDARKLNKRLKLYGNKDEFTRLAVTFNSMLDRLEDSFRRQNTFISDASHELRTPLSIIKGYVDILDRWGKYDKNVLQEGIEALKKEEAEMEKLIERLLLIARGDSRNLKLNKETFILNDILNEVIKETSMLNRDRNIVLNMDDEIDIFADKSLIKELLRILLDNAVKYTETDGKIEVLCRREGQNTVIKVKDEGIGIPSDEIPYIFDRFYRVDKARAKETGGAGLGLSIAKIIVEAHKGSIIVDSKIHKGTEFTIIFPF
jgi:heavy metal sensor kinase